MIAGQVGFAGSTTIGDNVVNRWSSWNIWSS